jgi:hypothetical protein
MDSDPDPLVFNLQKLKSSLQNDRDIHPGYGFFTTPDPGSKKKRRIPDSGT